MKNPPNPIMTWVPAPALAVIGAVMVRWLAPCFMGRAQAIVIVVGYLLVPVGLFWFASQLGKRAAQRSVSASDSVPRSSP